MTEIAKAIDALADVGEMVSPYVNGMYTSIYKIGGDMPNEDGSKHWSAPAVKAFGTMIITSCNAYSTPIAIVDGKYSHLMERSVRIRLSKVASVGYKIEAGAFYQITWYQKPRSKPTTRYGVKANDQTGETESTEWEEVEIDNCIHKMHKVDQPEWWAAEADGECGLEQCSIDDIEIMPTKSSRRAQAAEVEAEADTGADTKEV
jgi:hypothetical protein